MPLTPHWTLYVAARRSTKKKEQEKDLSKFRRIREYCESNMKITSYRFASR